MQFVDLLADEGWDRVAAGNDALGLPADTKGSLWAAGKLRIATWQALKTHTKYTGQRIRKTAFGMDGASVCSGISPEGSEARREVLGLETIIG